MPRDGLSGGKLYTCHQETLLHEENAAAQPASASSKWANRKLVPEYAAMEQTGAFSGGTKSNISPSEERGAR